MPDASKVFDEMPEKDIVSWNAIISACNNARDVHGCELAFSLLDRMKQVGMMPNDITYVCVLESIVSEAEMIAAYASYHLHLPLLLLQISSGLGSSDVMVGTALINVHARAGSLGKKTDDVFDLISEPNVVAWTAMISAHALDQHDRKALQLFARMLMQGTAPDMVAYLNAIVSCTNLMALNEGKLMHARLRGCGFATELPVTNALMNMYAKCGESAIGWGIFNEMPARNVASWNVMVATCAQHGLGARCLLRRMVGEVGAAPDKVTFVTYLSACSHIGSVDEAIHAVSRVGFDDPALVPTLEHYDCIVDMLGRAGLLQEADCVIGFMPHQPSALSWMTLLTTCRNLLDPRRGETSLSHILEVDPHDYVPYVMLANIYAALGRSEEASTMLTSMMMVHHPDAFPEDDGCYCLEDADLIDELLCRA
jgi:pentatricopeptide repeat protein